MVRPDEDPQLSLPLEWPGFSRCVEPAGVSPVPVEAGLPGSRPRAEWETSSARAGRQKPLRRKQTRGPQSETVNAAASSDLQREGRAHHVGAKAISDGPVPERPSGFSGVGAAAREEGSTRNRRDPSAQPSSGRSGPYKPKAKSAAVQRESEGVVVPVKPGNSGGGKDPCGGDVGSGGKREGMSGRMSRSKHPSGHESGAKVRRLQRRLWGAAKRQPERRFHALYDRICRSDVLQEAWKRVKENRGSAGVDGVTLSEIEQQGVERFLEALRQRLLAGGYRPEAIRRRYIPKADGGRRPLGIPTVRDRVVQAAAKLVLEPIFEADFLPCSYGFRPKRNATQALETLRKRAYRDREGNCVLDADIRNFFGTIDHDRLMDRVSRRVSDRRVLKLLRQWLVAGVMEEGKVSVPTEGTPQGGVISPLLSNIYLHVLDARWSNGSGHLGTLVRYADDFVVMCDTAEACEDAERRIGVILSELGLELHPEKTRRVDLTDGRQGFDFLGCHLRKRMSGRLKESRGMSRYYLQRWPSARSTKRIRSRVKEKTGRNRNGVKDVRTLVADLNPVLRGWGNYFRTGNAAQKFVQLDRYVERRLRRFLVKRKGRNLRAGEVLRWNREFFESHGLCRLRGTIRYPEAA